MFASIMVNFNSLGSVMMAVRTHMMCTIVCKSN